jgi:hypothetical protein
LNPPLSNMEILKGVHMVDERPENVVQKRSKPRASALLSDARECAYMMAGIPYSDPHSDNPERVDGKFTQEQGRLAEDITCAAINTTGTVRVVNRQIELPEDYFVTGHPDGELEFSFPNGHMGRDWDTTLNGMKWGFEHKMYGRYQLLQIAKQGLFAAAPEAVAQALLYGDALGWDAVMFVIASQDASSMRYEYRASRVKEHPKLNVYGLYLRSMYDDYLPMLKARAEWFTDWYENDGNPANVAIEARDVKGTFPWGYSEYRSLAIADGPGTLVAPQSPFVRDWAK